MSANSNFTVAIHILTLLAQTDTPLSSSYIAGSVNTNPVTIRRMVGLLREAGLVETLPGSTGGAVLRKAAHAITLADVYRIVQEDATLFGLHPNTPNPNCLIGRNIQRVLVAQFDAAQQLMLEELAQTTIQGILDAVRVQNQSA